MFEGSKKRKKIKNNYQKIGLRPFLYQSAKARSIGEGWKMWLLRIGLELEKLQKPKYHLNWAQILRVRLTHGLLIGRKLG